MSLLLAAIGKGSFSAAARDMGIPVPTLTRKITDLEEQLGTQLLMRSTRKLTLTDAGIAYVEAARRILDLVEEQERAAVGEFIAPRGELVITASVLFGRLHVLPVILEFLALYPEINITLLQSDRNADLIGEQVDLAVRVGKLPDSGMIATPVCSMRTVVCASPALLAERGTPQTPEDLLQLPCVMFSGPKLSPGWRFRVPGTDAFNTLAIKPRLRVATPDAAAHAAKRGVGFVYLFEYHVADAVEANELEIVLQDFEVGTIPVHLVHASRAQMPIKLRRFIDFAVPKLRQSLSKLGQR
ncbi:LysR family transcriptional regulator [Caballeronia hypogeia]|uniref:LysR family transcriptional regulator n=1 Tax=Caballeronia hypogeia TaxID=1777140 RepID=A0A158D3M2_9BURK|nr:LysR substrate-binding domain-containing protein [Caballeronia hypogeia]SAK89198.1 LysR family transcriptional regulator [Caballeronia hypogeia]